jgi:predicted nucleic acid-binding protein
MRVLLDTDVVLDHLLAREPFLGAVTPLFELIAMGDCEGYIAAITPLNVFYITRKAVGAEKAKQVIIDLLMVVRVCPLDYSILTSALPMPFSDYEDAVQHASATASGLDAIVTRNLDDYKNATLPIFAPMDFLNYLKAQQS